MSKIIAQGAEAKIILSNGFIIKDRISKKYRLKALDEKIIKQRTKSETKLLLKASEIINSPRPFFTPNFNKIKMPFIYGKRLSTNLDSFTLKKQEEICKIIGMDIGKLHDAGIIHGDLTTSNMILVENSDKGLNKIDKKVKNKGTLIINHKSDERSEPISEREASNFAKQNCKTHNEQGCELGNKFSIFFIDFGLGYISHKTEDKAVDLHLLKQALEAKHFKNWQILWKQVENGYKNSKESSNIIERLKAVEKRGRYKDKY